jgi:NADPH-dependent 2,4-dienoyl-CoA reductase/sulfur reductase-like enzyme/nitrite reductase/ring-hydroxylating ferredoxin subunit
MNTRKLSVADVGDLGEGQMKEVTIEETTILLARVGESYHALTPHCPHYGAPLAKGALFDGRIVCPWHHACFDAATGDLLEPPSLDALACHPVTIENGEVIVHLPEDVPDRRTPAMAGRDAAVSDSVAIIGGGAAGYMAAQTLREDGFTGRVVMITRENRPPYDRPNLSKDYLHGEADPEWMPLRSEEFFREHDIELMLETEVTRVDAGSRTVTFGNGRSEVFGKILLATGGTPRRLEIPGAELANVHMLRSFADADAIIGSAEGASRAVVVGASFIGMEAAFSLRKRGLEVTVVGPEPVPFSRSLGHEIGSLFQSLHESNGVAFRLGATVVGFEGRDHVASVVLESGEKLPADLVIVGIGVAPATSILHGVELGKDGSVTVDEHLMAAEGVYAAGDIARYPDPHTGEPTRVEHWRAAIQQGRVAAHNMAGRRETFDRLPFFWTQQFGRSLRYIGHATEWDEIIWNGDVDSFSFIAYYIHGGKVVAAASMGHDTTMARLEKGLPSVEQLRG